MGLVAHNRVRWNVSDKSKRREKERRGASLLHKLSFIILPFDSSTPSLLSSWIRTSTRCPWAHSYPRDNPFFFSHFARFHAPNAQCLTQIYVSFAPRSFFCVLTILLFPFHFLPEVVLMTLSGKGYMREIQRSTVKCGMERKPVILWRRPVQVSSFSLPPPCISCFNPGGKIN